VHVVAIGRVPPQAGQIAFAGLAGANFNALRGMLLYLVAVIVPHKVVPTGVDAVAVVVHYFNAHMLVDPFGTHTIVIPGVHVDTIAPEPEFVRVLLCF